MRGYYGRLRGEILAALAAEIGTDVQERLHPVPDKPHIPDDVILSFDVA